MASTVPPSSLSAVTVKPIPAVRVVGLREQIESFREQGRLWKTLTDFIASLNVPKAGPGFAVHYNLGAVVGQSGNIDVEVCIPVDDQFSMPSGVANDGLKLHEIPSLERAACVTLSGPCTGLPDAYSTAFAWIKEHDEKQNAPTREVYLTYDVDPMGELYRCEVIVPLA